MEFNELADKELPYSLEAEQTILGAILIDHTVISTILEFVTTKSFYIDKHRELFRIMMDMFTSSQTADAVTVLNEALKRNIFEKHGKTEKIPEKPLPSDEKRGIV